MVRRFSADNESSQDLCASSNPKSITTLKLLRQNSGALSFSEPMLTVSSGAVAASESQTTVGFNGASLSLEETRIAVPTDCSLESLLKLSKVMGSQT